MLYLSVSFLGFIFKVENVQVKYFIIFTLFAGIFEVDDDSLRVGKMGLDFEKQDLYLISVKSMDDGEPPKSVEVITHF